jgi:hypothetical protein
MNHFNHTLVIFHVEADVDEKETILNQTMDTLILNVLWQMMALVSW